MKREFIHQLILIERDRAEKLHPEWPEDIIYAAAILMEEAGSLIKACLDLVYFRGDERSVRDEAISVAAMVERFLLDFPEHYSHFQARDRLAKHLEKEFRKDPKFKRKD